MIMSWTSPVNLINNTDCDKNIEIKIDVALLDSRGQAESKYCIITVGQWLPYKLFTIPADFVTFSFSNVRLLLFILWLLSQPSKCLLNVDQIINISDINGRNHYRDFSTSTLYNM